MAKEYSPAFSHTSKPARSRAWRIGVVVIISSFIPILIYNVFMRSPKSAATILTLRPQKLNPAAASSTLQASQRLEDTTLTSPSGQYQFRLEDNGRLMLLDLWSNKAMFSSHTGMYLGVTWHTLLRSNGIFELSWTHVSESLIHDIAWTSNELAGCHPVKHIGLSKLEESQPILELLDSGLLQIRTAEEVLCTISKAVEDKGRLAISYTGFLRTYLKTCDSHMEKIISPWNGSGGVDIHVFVYDEETYDDDAGSQGESITYDTVHNHLKACFGDNLKTFAFVSSRILAQGSAALPQDVIDRCSGPDKIDHVLSEYYAQYKMGQQIRKYMLQNAIKYDYILRFRPEIFVADAPELQAVNHERIINIRDTYGSMHLEHHHDSSTKTGFTDILAYGRASAMWTYFDTYTGLQSMWDWADVADISPDLARLKRCDAQAILNSWLALNGLDLETDWRWRMSILSKDEHII